MSKIVNGDKPVTLLDIYYVLSSAVVSFAIVPITIQTFRGKLVLYFLIGAEMFIAIVSTLAFGYYMYKFILSLTKPKNDIRVITILNIVVWLFGILLLFGLGWFVVYAYSKYTFV